MNFYRSKILLDYYSFLPNNHLASLSKILTEEKYNKVGDMFSFTDLNKPDTYGNTPLHYAAIGNNCNLFLRLILLGANPYVCNNKGFNSMNYLDEAAIEMLIWDPSLKFLYSLESSSWINNQICNSFKEFLFKKYIKYNPTKFKTIKSIVNFLKKIGIDCEENICLAISSSEKIVNRVDSVISWLKSASNQSMFTSLFIQELQPQLYSNLNEDFFELPIELDVHFFDIYIRCIEKIDEDKCFSFMFRKLTGKLISSGKLEKVKNVNPITFKNLYSNKLAHKIFLEELLEFRKLGQKISVNKI